MNNFKFEVSTQTVDKTILQTMYSVTDEYRTLITQRVLDTQDEQVKAALISLGWTPPKEVV